MAAHIPHFWSGIRAGSLDRWRRQILRKPFGFGRGMTDVVPRSATILHAMPDNMEGKAHGTVLVIVRRVPVFFDKGEGRKLRLEWDKLEIEIRRGRSNAVDGSGSCPITRSGSRGGWSTFGTDEGHVLAREVRWIPLVFVDGREKFPKVWDLSGVSQSLAGRPIEHANLDGAEQSCTTLQVLVEEAEHLELLALEAPDEYSKGSCDWMMESQHNGEEAMVRPSHILDLNRVCWEFKGLGGLQFYLLVHGDAGDPLHELVV
jgi:hypothetical protein